jgi:hypothetical protein
VILAIPVILFHLVAKLHLGTHRLETPFRISTFRESKQSFQNFAPKQSWEQGKNYTMRKRGLKIGSFVRFVKLPGWVKDLPIDSRYVFKRALGVTLKIVTFDRYGDLVLEVNPKHRGPWRYDQIIVNCRYVSKPRANKKASTS